MFRWLCFSFFFFWFLPLLLLPLFASLKLLRFIMFISLRYSIDVPCLVICFCFVVGVSICRFWYTFNIEFISHFLKIPIELFARKIKCWVDLTQLVSRQTRYDVDQCVMFIWFSVLMKCPPTSTWDNDNNRWLLHFVFCFHIRCEPRA